MSGLWWSFLVELCCSVLALSLVGVLTAASISACVSRATAVPIRSPPTARRARAAARRRRARQRRGGRRTRPEARPRAPGVRLVDREFADKKFVNTEFVSREFVNSGSSRGE